MERVKMVLTASLSLGRIIVCTLMCVYLEADPQATAVKVSS